MNLKEAKQKLLKYVDFYGGDIPQKDKIKEAISIDELVEVIEEHRRLLEDTLQDALTDLDNLINEMED